MNNKFLKHIMKPYFRVVMIAMIVLTVLLLFQSLFLGIAAGVLTVGMFFFCKSYAGLRNEDLKKYSALLGKEMDGTARQFLQNDPRPLCMMDADGTILWTNKHFDALYDTAEPMRMNITDVTGLKLADIAQEMNTDKFRQVERKNHTYRVYEYGGDSVCLIYWNDVTVMESLKTLYNEERLCYIHLAIDNYDEFLAEEGDDHRVSLRAEMDKAIRHWAEKYDAHVERLRGANYMILAEQKDYERMEENHFEILDAIRSIETTTDYPVSVSLGIGVGAKSLKEAEEFADAALDLALGRGGDQAVVKKKNRVIYYGGTMDAVEKRNKGKSRIMAHALKRMMEQSDRIFIMGHSDPDMDALGAALGVSAIARASGRESTILLGQHNRTLDPILERAVAAGAVFQNGAVARDEITEESLVVIVDVNILRMTECPELLEKTDKIVLIDHHRITEESLDTAVLSYLEAYASSTSELVTEILEYMGDSKRILEKAEAEALLAGIYLDTKNFATKTGVRTFEAASWLRRAGADTAQVHRFFQSSFEETKMRAEIIAKAEMLPGDIAMALCENKEEGENIRVVLAQAADTLLTIEEVKASIVIGRNEEGQTLVSARSLGDVNVQTIMEKIGGGGHFTMAGAQPTMTPEETANYLRKVLTETEE